MANGEPKKVLEELDVMNKSFSDLYGPEDDPKTDPPATDEPKTEPPTTDEPLVTDEPVTESPSTDEPATDPPATSAPDDRDQIIADLRTKLADKDSEPKPTSPPATVAPLNLDAQDFIGDEDVESLVNNKESFNKLLNLVYSKGISDSRSIVGEGVAKAIPPLVSNQMDVVTQMKEIRDGFYANNEDLKAFPNVVATVFDDLSRINPDHTYGDLMEAIAPEVRKRLNLPEQTNKTKTKSKSNPPRLPRKKGKPGRSDNKPKLSHVESELDEMNEVLRR